jgi:hypothetical protein
MITSNHRVAAVAAGAAILVGFGSFGAVASGMITSADIKNHEVKTADIDRGAVGSGKIEDGSVKMRDLDPSTVSELQGGKTAGDAPQGAKGEKGDTGPQGPAGAQGPKGDQGAPGRDGFTVLSANSTGGPVTIENIGGSFGKFSDHSVRATEVDSFVLPAGTHQLTSNGFFHSTEKTSGLTRLQLALRVDDGTAWGEDFGTCFTDAASPLADREATCSTTRVVSVADDTLVKVYAFGYDDNQGSTDSGKFTASAYTSAVKVVSAVD